MDSKEQSERAAPLGGLSILAALVLGVAVWLAYLSSPSIPLTDAESLAGPADFSGFRADAWFLPDDEMLGFVEIPAGPFLMGSNAAVDAVTVAQFGAFVAATRHRVAEQTLQRPPDHPVANVSWPEALAYGRWLETTLGASPQTPPRLRDLLRNGGRVGLPSEAEWEKAARGTDGRTYPWGNEPRRDRANYAAQATTRVGSFDCLECAFNLADMSGNVWEWTRSPYQPYPFDPSDDRQDLDTDALWVMRGGSFGDTEQNVRAATRGGGDPGARRPFMGFRVVLSRF